MENPPNRLSCKPLKLHLLLLERDTGSNRATGLTEADTQFSVPISLNFLATNGLGAVVRYQRNYR